MKRLRMFTNISILMLMLTGAALAEEQSAPSASPPAKDAQAFEKRKAVILEKLDKRISSLQELRGCVASANGREDMDKCREKFKEERGTDKGESRGK